MKRSLSILACLCLCACATRPKTYQPPSPAKINASTQRVSVAVDKAHTHAREAQGKVGEATKLAGQVATGTKALKDVPPVLLQQVTDLEARLNEATTAQTRLESDLVEADAAKAQVEKDKTEYYASAKQLADTATDERNSRIADETKLHWYRMHWWGTWIVFGLGILACIALAVLKFMGKLTFL